MTSTALAPFPLRGGLNGEPVDLYMYNNTISNSGIGVLVNSETGDDTTGDTAFQAIILNNTFYNDGVGFQTVSPEFDGKNDQANVTSLIR